MYRKFKADGIFNGYDILPADSVLITDYDGNIIDIIKSADAGQDVQTFNGLISPGFINCHCHLELSHLKGLIPKSTGLVDFLLSVVRQRHFPEQEIFSAIEAGEKEMLSNGIVAAGDICNTAFTIPQKSKQHICYHNFIEVAGVPPALAAQRFQHSVEIFNKYSDSFPDNSIVPHAPYSVSKELMKLINEFPGNDLLTIHNQESTAENEFFLEAKGDLPAMFKKMNIDISFFKASGKSSLQTFLPYLKNQRSLILVHNVCTSADDILFAASTFIPEIFYCFCPNANLYISGMLPDIHLFLPYQKNIILGTDSLASNDQLSILEEIKTLKKYYPPLSITDLLQWATINGARALKMDNILGSFEKGKQPGVVLIERMGEHYWEEAKATRIL